MQKEKIAELEGILSTSNFQTAVSTVSNNGNGLDDEELVDERTNGTVGDNSQSNLLSARIQELESLLLDSDTEVVALQNMMAEIEKESEEKVKELNAKLKSADCSNGNPYTNGNSYPMMDNPYTASRSNNLSTKSNASESPEDGADLHLSRIYPNHDQTPFGGTNPLSASPEGKHLSGESNANSALNAGQSIS